MKTTSRLLFLALIAVADYAYTAEKVSIPPDVDYFIKDERYTTKEERVNWQQRLNDTPGIADRLFDVLWQCFAYPGDLTAMVTNALMEIRELPPHQLQTLSKMLRQLAESGQVSQISPDKRGLFGTMCLLRRAPTAENEDLALLLLECDDSLVRSQAATTLGWIGTERSVGPMKRHFDPFRKIKTDPPNEGEQVFEAEQMLLARVAAKSESALSAPTTPQHAPVRKDAPRSLRARIESSTTPKIVAAVTVIAFAWLLWLFFRKRA